MMLRRFAFPLLLLVVLLVYLGTAGGRAILDDGDALYAHIAQEMVRSDEWVTPYANGVRFLDKPPMMYWLMGFGYRIFGFTEFAARLPSALAVIGIGVVVFMTTRKWAGHNAAIVAFTASTLCIGTFLFTRMVFPDILFLFFLTLSLKGFLEWYMDERNPLLPALLFYAAAAGAVLSKGLIGLVFPAAIIGLFTLWSGNIRRLLHFRILPGTLLFAVLALPWHILAAQRNPGFLWYYFVNEQFLRFLGKRQPFDYESISLPVFWGLVLVWIFPWSAFLPAVRHTVAKLTSQDAGTRALIRLNLCWIIVMLVFFSLSSRIEHYSLPIFAPLAMLIGVTLAPGQLFGPGDFRRQRSVDRCFAFLGLLGGLVGISLIGAALWAYGLLAGPSLQGAGTGRLHAYKYYFAPLFDMPPEVLAKLAYPLAGTCGALVAGLLLAWFLNRRGARLAAVSALSLMMTGFCFFAFQSIGICEEMISSKRFGETLERIYRPGDDAIIVGDFETANSVNFYAPAILRICEGSAALLQWGMNYPDAPGLIVSRKELLEKWSGPRRVFLIAPEKGEIVESLDPLYVLVRSGGRVLLCNQDIDFPVH